jgi:hypothetical protein
MDSFCSRGAATILDRKSTEYAFIGILFLVDSIVPHNIRKCCIYEFIGGDVMKLSRFQALGQNKQLS